MMKKYLLCAASLACLCLTPCFAESAPVEKTDEAAAPRRSAPSIDDLTEKILESAHQAQFKKRARPKDFNFTDNKLVDKYLAGISDQKILARERKRISIIETARMELGRCFGGLPYEGEIRGPGGGKRKGIIMFGDDTCYAIKSRATAKEKKQKWTTLSPQTMVLAYEYYGDLRLSMGAPDTSREELQEQAADLFFKAAVFADWYGDYAKAVDLVQKAVKYNPALESLAEKLFLDPPPETVVPAP